MIVAALCTWPSMLQNTAWLVFGRRSALRLLLVEALSVAAPARAEEVASTLPDDQSLIAAKELVFPAWLAGDWACASELFKADSGPGELVLASAVPGAQQALTAAKSTLGTSAAVGRERRQWRLTGSEDPVVGVVEVRRSVPTGIAAVAAALAGADAVVEPTATATPDAPTWDARAPTGLEWRLRPVGSATRPDSDQDKFRTSEFFEARALVTLTGELAVPSALRIDTVYKRVPADASPTGGKFKIGLGTIDSGRSFIVQAIQTATIFPPPPAPDKKSSDIALATYKKRLLFSPILPEAA